jgi:hypothetical protein
MWYWRPVQKNVQVKFLFSDNQGTLILSVQAINKVLHIIDLQDYIFFVTQLHYLRLNP